MTALIALGATLGVGATALAQAGDERLSIDFQDGCLTGSRVSLAIAPPTGETISALTVYANGREALDLTGLTGEARMTVRLVSDRGRVTVSGELSDGGFFERSRDFRPCAPRPAAPQRTTRPEGPEQPLTGGGEG